MKRPLKVNDGEEITNAKVIPTDKELTRKKLEQESHWSKIYLIPYLPIITTLLIVSATIWVGYDTEILKKQTVTNDSTKATLDKRKENDKEEKIKNDNEQVLKTNELVEKNIIRLQTNAEQDRINRELKSEYNIQRKINDNLTKTISTKELEVNSLQTKHSYLQQEVGKLSDEATYWKLQTGFSNYEYHLKLLRDDLLENKRISVDFLVNGIRNDKSHSKKIIDNLLVIMALGKPFLYGACNYILYNGTGDDFYLKNILEEIKYRNKSSFNNINYLNMFCTDRWTGGDIQKIVSVILETLSFAHEKNNATTLLLTVARIQDYYGNFNLYDGDFPLFLKYLNICKKNYSNNPNSNEDINIMWSISVICPPLFIARKTAETDASLKYMKPIFANKKIIIDSVKMEKINNPSMIAGGYSYNVASDDKLGYYEKILEKKVKQTLNPDNIQNKKFSVFEIIKIQKQYLKLYNEFFEDKPIDLNDFKNRLKANII